jgi:hypothetical protein
MGFSQLKETLLPEFFPGCKLTLPVGEPSASFPDCLAVVGSNPAHRLFPERRATNTPL